MLDPRSPSAESIADLWWIMFSISLAVFLLVVGILTIGLIRASRRAEAAVPSPAAQWTWVIAGGIALPVVVLMALMVLSILTGRSIVQAQSGDMLTIEVNGRQWWWEVRYSDQQFVTANEIHIPAGEPVRLVLTAQDLIHSFWVPQLAGKTDLIPGRTNSMTIEASEPGVYQGQCAEFCGLQHAKMGMLVIAQEPAEFEAWVESQRKPQGFAEEGILLQGQQVFLGSACVYCHTVEGTSAAGTIPNTRGYLAGWILSPQTVKPGTQMPSTQLSPEELEALMAYLMSLD
jgi:cytochrome c oxidase subunit 2